MKQGYITLQGHAWDETAVADRESAELTRAVVFGPFRLLLAQRLLLEGERPVRLGSRATDILIALVERAGDLVGKSELMTLVWPDTFVEEGNLKVNVAALRRALGDGQGGRRHIVTTTGQGYRFVAPIRAVGERELALSHRIASHRRAQAEQFAGQSGSIDRPRRGRQQTRAESALGAALDARWARRDRQDCGRPCGRR